MRGARAGECVQGPERRQRAPAGPKSVAPVSVPATARTADIMRCSMNGRAMTSDTGIHLPALLFAMSSALVKPHILSPSLLPSKRHDALSASSNEMCVCMSESSL